MYCFTRFENESNTNTSFFKTGVAGLDNVLGGGVPFNSLLIIEEDDYSIYCDLLIKCLVSNCLYSKHSVIYFSSLEQTDVFDFVKVLPSLEEIKHNERSKDEMKIAFRYHYLPNLDEGYKIRLSFRNLISDQEIKDKKLKIDEIDLCPIESILEKLETCKGKEVGVVIIHQFSSVHSPIRISDIPRLLYTLKSYSRKLKNSSFIVTLRISAISKEARKLIHNIGDNIIQLVSFDKLLGSAYTDYDGAINVHKLSNIAGALKLGAYHTANIGFKFKKSNYFVIEKLSLPPDIGDMASRIPTKFNSFNQSF